MNNPCSPRELVVPKVVRPVNNILRTCSRRELVVPIFRACLVRPVNTLKDLPDGAALRSAVQALAVKAGGRQFWSGKTRLLATCLHCASTGHAPG